MNRHIHNESAKL